MENMMGGSECMHGTKGLIRKSLILQTHGPRIFWATTGTNCIVVLVYQILNRQYGI